MQKSSEVAKDLIFGRCLRPKKHQWFAAPPGNHCLECIASAIQEQVRGALEEAAKISESHAWDFSTYPSRVGLVQGIAEAIRKLIEKVE